MSLFSLLRRAHAWRVAPGLLWAGAALAQTAAPAAPPTAMIRVACDGGNAGAEVTLNGVFKGECPFDVPVAAGTWLLRAVKPVDALRERVFTQELRIAPETVRRVEVELGEPQLNAAGQRAAAERQAQLQAQAAREAAERRVRHLALVTRAEAGELPAMVELAHWIAGEEYASGADGESRRAAYAREQAQAQAAPPTDPVLKAWYRGSLHWYQRVVDAGDAAALFFTTTSWAQAPGGVLALMRAMVSEPMPPVRQVNAVGLPAILALVDSDPFFLVGQAKGQWNAHLQWNDTLRASRQLHCRRGAGQVFAISGEERRHESPNFPNTTWDYTLDHQAALGGLLTLSYSRTRFLDRTKWQLHSIDAVYGQPFPLGQRFGLFYRRDAGGRQAQLHCTRFWRGNSPTANRPPTGAACFESDGSGSRVHVLDWHEPSGCFQLQPAAWPPEVR